MLVATFNLYNATYDMDNSDYLGSLSSTLAKLLAKEQDLSVFLFQELMGKGENKDYLEWVKWLENLAIRIINNKYPCYYSVDCAYLGGPKSRSEWSGCIVISKYRINLSSDAHEIDTREITNQSKVRYRNALRNIKKAEIEKINNPKYKLRGMPELNMRNILKRARKKSPTFEHSWFRKYALFTIEIKIDNFNARAFTIASAHCPGPNFSQKLQEIPRAYLDSMKTSNPDFIVGDFNTDDKLSLIGYEESQVENTTISNNNRKYDRILFKMRNYKPKLCGCLSPTFQKNNNSFENRYFSDHMCVWCKF
ncbi:hypothetical protein [Pseudoalteromonas sp. PS5]|uniref:hypothetical protein n=1 Tax=Pseudoalteromonas sp. PS5 TaxID=1437473 RepID=UPI000FFE7B2F|nr:hypothetical protein [Pseudoalteromonas sp. PS5]RXF05947.1 hypothetical protein D9603_02815 [Pseudoalteromonas sp. PS5]